MSTSKTEPNEQLCNVGDILYKVGKDDIIQIKITEVLELPHHVYRDDRGYSYFNRTLLKSCFKTREEAEQEYKRRKIIIRKKQMLKDYERELNQKFNLGEHYIVK